MNNYLQHITEDQIFTLSTELNIKRVSPSLIRKLNGYNEMSDQEIEQVINSLYKLSFLTLYLSNL